MDNKHDYKHNRTNHSHAHASGPANSCSISNRIIDGDMKNTNGVNIGSGSESGSGGGGGSRSTSATRGPAPFPPSLTYNGILPDTAARRQEKREYRKKQEEIMRRLADTPLRGVQQTNTLHSSSSSSSLGAVVRQQQGKPSGASICSISANSTALCNGSFSGSGYDSDQGYGGHNGNSRHHVHDGRDPLTRLRDLRQNVGRAISGIEIGLAVTSDEDGYIYDGHGVTYQYHEDDVHGYDSYGSGYGAYGHDSYGGYDKDGYGVSSGDLRHATGRGEGEICESQREGGAQDRREAKAERQYTLLNSSSLSRYHYHHHYYHRRNRDQRNNSPPPFLLPSWPSLPSLPLLPSLSGPSRSSLETEEWFPSLYLAHAQQSENQSEDTSSDYDEPANSDNTTDTQRSKRAIRRNTISAASNGTEGNGNRNGWDTLEPLMRELTGNGDGNEPNGAIGTAVSTSGIDDDEQNIHRIVHERHEGEARQLVDNNGDIGFGPMDEKDLEEETETMSRIRAYRASLCAELRALEASVNLLHETR